MDTPLLLAQLLNAAQTGLLLFLTASGLTLVFGIMGVINLAHGSFYMMGAYLAFWLQPLAIVSSLGLLGSLLVCALVAAAVGYLLEWAFFRFLYTRDHLQQVLLTYGLILVLEEVRSLLAGNDVHGASLPPSLAGSLSLGFIDYPVYRLFLSGLCLLLAGGMAWTLARTRLGMRIRAAASRRAMLDALGIRADRLCRLVFAAGVALAAVAGALAAPVTSVYPGMGHHILILCFVVVIIGGVGSVRGAFIAAMLVGLADTFGPLLVPDMAGALLYLLMAAVLLWRPQGLFGTAASPR